MGWYCLIFFVEKYRFGHASIAFNKANTYCLIYVLECEYLQ